MNSSGGFYFGKSCFKLMPGMPRLSAVHILITADAFLLRQTLDRNTLTEVVLTMVTISVCGGEFQVVFF